MLQCLKEKVTGRHCYCIFLELYNDFGKYKTPSKSYVVYLLPFTLRMYVSQKNCLLFTRNNIIYNPGRVVTLTSFRVLQFSLKVVFGCSLWHFLIFSQFHESKAFFLCRVIIHELNKPNH